MKTQFRLKKEARDFFENEAEKVKPMEYWEREGIHKNLLEKVNNVYITYGIVKGCTTHLKRWESSQEHEGLARFDFSINILDFSNQKYKEFDPIKLMDEFEEFLNKKYSNLI